MISFGTVIDEITGDGRYHILLLCLMLFASLAGPPIITGSIFLAGSSGSRCYIEAVDNSSRFVNVTETEIQEQLSPWDPVKRNYDTCQTYKYSFEKCDFNSTLTECTSMLRNISNHTIALSNCQSKFVHDRSVFESTIVTQWDLVCERLTLSSFSNSMFFVGMLLGALVGGVVADRFGRIITIRVGSIGSVILGCVTIFSPNVYVFTILRALTIFCYYPVLIAAVVCGIEFSIPKWRKYYGLAINACFGLGCVLFSVSAYFLRNWKDLQICLSCSLLLFFIVSLLLPKSPRWLFSMGKHEQAKRNCKLRAKRNNATLSETTWVELIKLTEKEEQAEQKNVNTLKETFRLPCTRFLTISNMVVWMVTSLVYFGLALNSGSLAGDKFLNNGIGGMMECVACLLSIPAITYFGCTKAITGALIISSLACLSSTAVIQFESTVPELKMIGVALAMIGRFGSSGAFGIIYLQTVELFPTCGRSTALGLAGVGARIGSMISPFSIQLQYSIPWLTQTIFGVLAALAAVLASTFPETQGKELAMTFDEAERNFRRDLRKTFLRCFFRKHTSSENESIVGQDEKENFIKA